MKKLYSMYSKKQKPEGNWRECEWKNELKGIWLKGMNVKGRISKVVGIFQFAFLYMLE